MTDITFATPDDLPDIFDMICALSDFHGDTATITLEQLRDIFGQVRIDIHHLFIKDGHRAKGVGTALIAKAKTYALSKNAERLSIGTDPDNTTSIAAYRAMPNLTEISGTGPRFWIDLTP